MKLQNLAAERLMAWALTCTNEQDCETLYFCTTSNKDYLNSLSMLRQAHKISRIWKSKDTLLTMMEISCLIGRDNFIKTSWKSLRLWGRCVAIAYIDTSPHFPYDFEKLFNYIFKIIQNMFETMENILYCYPDIMEKFRTDNLADNEPIVKLPHSLKLALMYKNASLDISFPSQEVLFSESLVNAIVEVVQMENSRKKRLEMGKCGESWATYMEKIMEYLLGDKVFYIDDKGVVKESTQVFKKLNQKNYKSYTEKGLLEHLKADYTISQAWCTKEGDEWKFIARLEEPKQEKVIVTEKSPEPQIIPSSSSSSSQGPAIETQEEVVIQEDLSHLLTIENEAEEVAGGIAPKKAKNNKTKMHGNIEQAYFSKGLELRPRYTGFLRAALRGEEVTLGKYGESYVYGELKEFVDSFKDNSDRVAVHCPIQCAAKQGAYLVSKLGQDGKPHIWFVLSKKGCVME